MVGFYDMESKVEVKNISNTWTPVVVKKDEESNGGDEDGRKNHIG